MSVYHTLSEAVDEAVESLNTLPTLGGIIIVKTKDQAPYLPILIMPSLGGKYDPLPQILDITEKSGNGKVVAVFATIR